MTRDSKVERFASLIAEVSACVTCDRMEGSARVLNYSAGNVMARLMFIGEAPGRLGADATEVPFHGDRAGENFENLLAFAGINRSELFVTNAVLCNPKDEAGNNSTPSPTEVANCAQFLKRQIELVNPEIVATLGGTALMALNSIEGHNLSLRDHARTVHEWFGRLLVPLYHPGQRAMIRRNIVQQQRDYRFLHQLMSSVNQRPRKSAGVTRSEILTIAKYLLSSKGTLTYFQLHKLVYLTEYVHVRRVGRRLTSAYFIRQAEGPYCTDLEINRLRRADGGIRVFRAGAQLHLQLGPDRTPRLFEESPLSEDAKLAADEALRRYGDKDNSELKTAAYLTAPMRFLLRRERATSQALLNVPIDFLAAA
jgi:uracil-DNA glycosylase family 4